MSCHIIAEIGTSHRGDLKRAEELVHAAGDAGADSAKFQIVIAEEIIHPLTGKVPLPGGSISLYEQFRSLEQSGDFYFRLSEICRNQGIRFSATPFGPKSAALLEELDPPYVKIASPELNYLPLLKQVAAYKRPVILSTGVSLLKDIEQAVDVCGRKHTTLLQCITAYPAPEEEYNLRLISLYRALFGCSAGVSDHSRDPLKVPLIALTQDAEVIEKHLCLDRGEEGLDDPYALTPAEFNTMCREVRRFEKLTPSDRLAEAEKMWGDVTVESVLGTGVKELAPSEKQNYGRSNRTLHALKSLAAGTVLTEENCRWLRTEKVLRPGVEPCFSSDVLGRKLTRDVPDGEGIRWEDLTFPVGPSTSEAD